MDDAAPNAPQAKRPKFKHTRELIRIAAHDGMTQKQIADLCRVEQSVVSNWLNGRTVAFEHQVAELRRRYGGRLNRTTSRVYLVRDEAPVTGPWEETERGRELLGLKREREELAGRLERAQREKSLRKQIERAREEQARAAPSPQPPTKFDAPMTLTELEADLVACMGEVDEGPDEPRSVEALEAELAALNGRVAGVLAKIPARWKAIERSSEFYGFNLELLAACERDAHEAARYPERVTVVEGPVVFRYSFVEHRGVPRGKVWVPTPVPIARWCVHQLARDRLLLVEMRRRTLAGVAAVQWAHLRGPWQDSPWAEVVLGARGTFEVDHPDDSARWVATLRGPMDAAALVAFSDAYLGDAGTVHDPRDDAALPFLLRKALVEHGHALGGVARIVASE